MAQVDSSIGGKTGVNNRFGKNMIGSFYQPDLVISDIKILNSLYKDLPFLGVCLGQKLYARLKGYSTITKIPMSRLIKTLVKNYLDEKGV